MMVPKTRVLVDAHALASLRLDIGKSVAIRDIGLLWIHQFGMVGIGERLTTTRMRNVSHSIPEIYYFFF